VADLQEEPWERWISAFFLLASLVGLVGSAAMVIVGDDRWAALLSILWFGPIAWKLWPRVRGDARRLVGKLPRRQRITLLVDGHEVTATGPSLERALRELHDQRVGWRPAVANGDPVPTGPAAVEKAPEVE
jgi:hypothetical protein